MNVCSLSRRTHKLGMALLFVIVGCVTFPSAFAEGSSDTPSFDALVNELSKANFKEKSRLINAIAVSGDARAIPILELMLKGQLFYERSSSIVVSRMKQEGGYLIVNALTGQEIGVVKKRATRKIKVNNALRKQLRGEIARLSLSNDDANVRLAAVQEVIKNPTRDIADLLRGMQEKEQNKKVLDAVNIALALLELDSNDKEKRITALSVLSGSLDAQITARIVELTSKNAEGDYVEADTDVRIAAEKALKNIQQNIKHYEFIETLFFGLSLGSVLLLAAIGLAITFGVMGVINMAHGELIMIGAYTTYVVQLLMPDQLEYSLLVAIPAAFIVAGLVGILIERGVIQFLYGRPLETLLATFGVSLILQQLVRTIFSPLNRSVETPEWMSGALEINSYFSLTFNRLYIIIFSLLVFVMLLLLLKKTVFGLQMRAVTQNRNMARAMGVRSTWVDALTFGLGSGIAGIAGVALSQLTNVGPNMGQAYIIDSFMVVVFGGVGNLWGTLVAAFSLGVVNKFLEPWAGAVLAKIVVLIFIILFIQKRPRGLFPQKGRNAEN